VPNAGCVGWHFGRGIHGIWNGLRDWRSILVTERTDLVSRADIATRAGVYRAAISNWARRHSDFPAPVIADGQRELFAADAVAAWLDRRRIPSNALQPGEEAGATYGTRFRQGGRHEPAHRTIQPDTSPAVDRVFRQLTGGKIPEGLRDDIYRELVLYAVSDRAATDPFAGRQGSPHATADHLHHIRAQLADLADDAIADLFDRLVAEFHAADRKRSPEPITPPSVTDLLSQLTANMAIHSVYDPYCRTGELLGAIAKGREDQQVTATGWSKSSHDAHYAKRRLLLRAAEPTIAYQRKPLPGGRHDLVVTNPQFNAKLTTFFDPRVWPFGTPPDHHANYGWLQHAYECMAGPLGRAVVLMPNTAAVSDNPAERAIRTKMIEAGVVECVIALPDRLFSATGATVMAWVLRPPAHDVPVLMVDATSLVERVGRLYEIPGPQRADIAAAYQAWRNGAIVTDKQVSCRAIGLDQLRAADYSLNPLQHTTAQVSRGEDQPTTLSAALAQAQSRATDADQQAARVVAEQPYNRLQCSGWTRVPLRDVCELQSGPSGSLLKHHVEHARALPVVEPKHLDGGRIDEPADRAVSERLDVTKYGLREQDILCTRNGTLGRYAMVAALPAGAVFDSGLIRLRTKAAGIDPHYLLHYLRLPSAQAWVRRHCTGTTVATMGAKSLGGLPVYVPPPDEQERIVYQLSALQRQADAHAEVAQRAQALCAAIAVALIEPVAAADDSGSAGVQLPRAGSARP
jgi:type I restriction enzyme M protein